MVFAFLSSGYSAVSHAMGMEDCSAQVSTELQDCQHADASTDKDHAQKHEKIEAAKCMDCTHCCSSSAVIIQSKPVGFDLTGTVFMPESSQAQPQGRIFSLLRPPRTLA